MPGKDNWQVSELGQPPFSSAYQVGQIRPVLLHDHRRQPGEWKEEGPGSLLPILLATPTSCVLIYTYTLCVTPSLLSSVSEPSNQLLIVTSHVTIASESNSLCHCFCLICAHCCVSLTLFSETIVLSVFICQYFNRASGATK